MKAPDASYWSPVTSRAMVPAIASVATGPNSVAEICDDLVRQRPDEQALIVIDAGVSALPAGFECISGVTKNLEVSDTVVLPESSRGSLDWARQVSDALRTRKTTICVAVGGGAVLDAAKTAVAALDQPWLLDDAIWRSSGGVLPVVRERDRGAGKPGLLAVSTRPGTAAQIAPRATLARTPGVCQQMAIGEGLVPDYAAVDSELWAGTGARPQLEALCEMLFRTLGPYLVTQRCTNDQEILVTQLVHDILQMGWRALQAKDNLSASDRARIDELSMASVDPRRTSGWVPSTHPWWSVQNSLATALSLPKRTLTPGGFRAVLKRSNQDVDPLRSRFRYAPLRPRKSALDMEKSALQFFTAAHEAIDGTPLSLPPATIDDVVNESFDQWKPAMIAGGWGDDDSVRQFLEYDL